MAETVRARLGPRTCASSTVMALRTGDHHRSSSGRYRRRHRPLLEERDPAARVGLHRAVPPPPGVDRRTDRRAGPPRREGGRVHRRPHPRASARGGRLHRPSGERHGRAQHARSRREARPPHPPGARPHLAAREEPRPAVVARHGSKLASRRPSLAGLPESCKPESAVPPPESPLPEAPAVRRCWRSCRKAGSLRISGRSDLRGMRQSGICATLHLSQEDRVPRSGGPPGGWCTGGSFRLWLPAPEPAGRRARHFGLGMVDQPHEARSRSPSQGPPRSGGAALDAREPPPTATLAVDAPADLPRQGISQELRAERFVRPHRERVGRGETVPRLLSRRCTLGRAGIEERPRARIRRTVRIHEHAPAVGRAVICQEPVDVVGG